MVVAVCKRRFYLTTLCVSRPLLDQICCYLAAPGARGFLWGRRGCPKTVFIMTLVGVRGGGAKTPYPRTRCPRLPGDLEVCRRTQDRRSRGLPDHGNTPVTSQFTRTSGTTRHG